MKGRLPRSRPEWITFAVSITILAVVVLLIAVQAFGPNDPAEPFATRRGPARRVGDRYLVAVDVANRGDRAAENVQVTAELRTSARTTVADQRVDFLSGHEAVTLQFAFDDDPDAAGSELTVVVAGFAEP